MPGDSKNALGRLPEIVLERGDLASCGNAKVTERSDDSANSNSGEKRASALAQPEWVPPIERTTVVFCEMSKCFRAMCGVAHSQGHFKCPTTRALATDLASAPLAKRMGGHARLNLRPREVAKIRLLTKRDRAAARPENRSIAAASSRIRGESQPRFIPRNRLPFRVAKTARQRHAFLTRAERVPE